MNTCLLCGSESLESTTLSTGRKYYQCEICQYLFLCPEQRLKAHQEKSRYLEHNNDLTDPRYIEYIEKTWAKIKAWVPGSGLIMDYGCGPTKGLEKALSQQPEYQVVSYDPIFYPNGRELFIGKVDVIYCSEALEHMFEPKTEIEMWLKLLRPGGLITLRTSFHPGLEAIEGWHYKNDPTHIGFFNTETFQWLAQKYNLERLHVHSPYVSFRKP